MSHACRFDDRLFLGTVPEDHAGANDSKPDTNGCCTFSECLCWFRLEYRRLRSSRYPIKGQSEDSRDEWWGAYMSKNMLRSCQKQGLPPDCKHLSASTRGAAHEAIERSLFRKVRFFKRARLVFEILVISGISGH
jgi:hypothetical protein